MTQIAHQDGMPEPAPISVRAAIRLAWVAWFILGVIPFLLFLCVVWTLGIRNAELVRGGHHTWFLISSAYLLIAVPCSFFLRTRLFKEYWAGHTVAPGKYLFGMIAMWMTLELGGILSLLGCFLDHSLLPNLLPAMLAFIFYATLWPSGRSMVYPVGHHEDPQIYEEPR
jgi:hypothetical protein